MSALLQYLVSGIATGCAFALVATGFVTIHRVTGVVNFAQGGFAILAGYLTFSALRAGLPHGVSELLAVLLATVSGAMVGVITIGRRGTPLLASLIITIGLGFLLYAVEVAVWGDQPLQFEGLPGVFSLAGLTLQRQYLLIVIGAGVTFAALLLFFNRTYLGKVFTACASNAYAARLAGINVTRVGIAAFALGGLLGGLAGVLLLPLRSLTFDSDVDLAVNGFAAAIFGGLQRPGAALAGGLVIGVAEALVAGYSRASYQKGVSLVLIVGILVWQASRRAQAD
ncbi:MAG: branched-chain amino acid ABC transporter permease [Candidatus Dormibacteraeota bacterium]|nr:branched-chain amino acid ABC transporter permease [Candidatus Dormibacteraeota bacterium]